MTREQSSSCVLSDTDIKEIQRLRIEGLTFREIAEKFNVQCSTVFYWCKGDDYRKSLVKNRVRKPNDYKSMAATQKKKRKLYPKEFRAYHRLLQRKHVR